MAHLRQPIGPITVITLTELLTDDNAGGVPEALSLGLLSRKAEMRPIVDKPLNNDINDTMTPNCDEKRASVSVSWYTMTVHLFGDPLQAK